MQISNYWNVQSVPINALKQSRMISYITVGTA